MHTRCLAAGGVGRNWHDSTSRQALDIILLEVYDDHDTITSTKVSIRTLEDTPFLESNDGYRVSNRISTGD